MSNKLIALVATAVLLNGVRTIIQPGEELPDLSAHDERELLQSGAAQDPEAVAKAERDATRAQKKADGDFVAAREAVQQAQASTGAPNATPKPAKPAAKQPAKPGA